jgi:hypothetical protein
MTQGQMRNSLVGDQWIYQTCQTVPVQRIIDEKTGQPTGDILTGPVRLAFCNLFELPKPSETVKEPKFGTAVLFTPWSDLTILQEEYYAEAARSFATKYDAQTQQYYGLRSPFRDQGEKIKFGGFTPGLTFMTCTSKYKPPVVDVRKNPIVDPSKVYPGVWAICAINTFAYKHPVNPGVAFGIQSVMIIADDEKFGGGAPDPNKTFGGVANVQAPIIRPDVAKGMPMGAQPPAPAGIPGYTQPGYGAPPARPGVGGFAPPPGAAPAADDDYDFMR